MPLRGTEVEDSHCDKRSLLRRSLLWRQPAFIEKVVHRDVAVASGLFQTFDVCNLNFAARR
jgi:hypothetical protein